MKNIGERIVYLREQQGISQKELAKQLGITAASLSRYENNIYDPKGNIIINLSKILNTSSDYLLGMTQDYRPISKPCTVTEQDLHVWELYRSLTPDAKLRVEERILTLHEMNNLK